MISSSYLGIMTLGVVMVLHNQRRLHLLKLKNYLSALSLCQVTSELCGPEAWGRAFLLGAPRTHSLQSTLGVSLL